MLFSCALLFFLFTTFVAAAPLQKSYTGYWSLIPHQDFLVHGGGEWTRVQSVLDLFSSSSDVYLTHMTGVEGNIDILYSRPILFTL